MTCNFPVNANVISNKFSTYMCKKASIFKWEQELNECLEDIKQIQGYNHG